MDCYSRLQMYCNKDDLKNKFIRGLLKMEARLREIDLSLDELLEKFDALEKLAGKFIFSIKDMVYRMRNSNGKLSKKSSSNMPSKKKKANVLNEDVDKK